MKSVLFFSILISSAVSLGEEAVTTPSPTPVATATPSATPNPTSVETASPAPKATPSVENKLHVVLKQIDGEANRAVGEYSGDSTHLTVGAQLVALQDGRNCFFSVTSISGSIVQLSIFRCPIVDKLKVGQVLEPSLFDDAQTSPQPEWVSPQRKFKAEKETLDDRTRLAISPYYGLGTTMSSNGLAYNQTGVDTVYGCGTITTTTAPGVALEIYHSPQYGFGWSGGAAYDFQRSVSGLNAYANGAYIGGAFNNPEPTLSILSFYGNAIYRLDSFYFPFGLNYAFPSFQGGGNSFGNTTITGGAGIQLGAGYILTDRLSAEFIMQDMVLDGSSTTPGGTIVYHGLSFINPQFRLRFSF